MRAAEPVWVVVMRVCTRATSARFQDARWLTGPRRGVGPRFREKAQRDSHIDSSERCWLAPGGAGQTAIGFVGSSIYRVAHDA